MHNTLLEAMDHSDLASNLPICIPQYLERRLMGGPVPKASTSGTRSLINSIRLVLCTSSNSSEGAMNRDDHLLE